MARPAFRATLLIFLSLLMACATSENNPGSSNVEEGKADAKTLLSDEAVSPADSGLQSDKEDMEILSDEDWLEKARIAWFDKEDRDLTEYCLDRVYKKELADDREISLYQLLCRKIYTRLLPLEDGGLADRNISSLHMDGDDLWIGTWTGGVGRYSLPLEDFTLFRPSRESLRVETLYDFEISGDRIHMAGYSDLYEYDRRTSRFESFTPQGLSRINNLEEFKGTLYASTIGSGLWRSHDGLTWDRTENITSSSRINTLFHDSRDSLLIGTADRGVLVFDGRKTVSLGTLYPGFKGKNITTISEQGDWLLIGTYGEGGYLINRSSGWIGHCNKEQGDLLSDYILCSGFTGRFACFGSLGGGLSLFSLEDGGEWFELGLESGLLSLDAAALLYYGGYLYVANLGQGVMELNERIIEKTL